jgi:hypothetical protein
MKAKQTLQSDVLN